MGKHRKTKILDTFQDVIKECKDIMRDDVVYVERYGGPSRFKGVEKSLLGGCYSVTFTLVVLRLQRSGECTEERRKVEVRWTLHGENGIYELLY